MANRPLSIISLDTKKISWADPTRLSTVFSAAIARKSLQLGAASLNHVKGTYVSLYKQPAPKPEGCADACVIMPNEPQSIRTEISGTAENLAKLKDLWEAHKRNVDALFVAKNAGLGFLDPEAVITSPDVTATE